MAGAEGRAGVHAALALPDRAAEDGVVDVDVVVAAGVVAVALVDHVDVALAAGDLRVEVARGAGVDAGVEIPAGHRVVDGPVEVDVLDARAAVHPGRVDLGALAADLGPEGQLGTGGRVVQAEGGLPGEAAVVRDGGVDQAARAVGGLFGPDHVDHVGVHAEDRGHVVAHHPVDVRQPHLAGQPIHAAVGRDVGVEVGAAVELVLEPDNANVALGGRSDDGLAADAAVRVQRQGLGQPGGAFVLRAVEPDQVRVVHAGPLVPGHVDVGAAGHEVHVVGAVVVHGWLRGQDRLGTGPDRGGHAGQGHAVVEDVRRQPPRIAPGGVQVGAAVGQVRGAAGRRQQRQVEGRGHVADVHAGLAGGTVVRIRGEGHADAVRVPGVDGHRRVAQGEGRGLPGRSREVGQGLGDGPEGQGPHVRPEGHAAVDGAVDDQGALVLHPVGAVGPGRGHAAVGADVQVGPEHEVAGGVVVDRQRRRPGRALVERAREAGVAGAVDPAGGRQVALPDHVDVAGVGAAGGHVSVGLDLGLGLPGQRPGGTGHQADRHRRAEVLRSVARGGDVDA